MQVFSLLSVTQARKHSNQEPKMLSPEFDRRQRGKKAACDINYVSAKNNTVRHTTPPPCALGWKYVICYVHITIFPLGPY